jgi:hypothetical protein
MALRESAAEVVTAQPNKLRECFVGLCEGLLNGIVDVFPECDASAHAQHVFCALVKGDPDLEDKFIRKCQKLFKNNAAQMKSRDPEAVFSITESIEILKGVDMRSKWYDPDFTQESQDSFWQYLVSLNTYSDLYSSVPVNTMHKIERMAAEVGEKFQSGDMDLSKIDLNEFGQDLMKSMTPAEMEQFEANLPDIYNSVGNVAAMMGGPNDPGGVPGLDVEGLMKKVAQMQSAGGNPEDAASQLLAGLAAGGQSGDKGGPTMKPEDIMKLAQSIASSGVGAGKGGGGGAGGAPSFDMVSLVRTLSGAPKSGASGGLAAASLFSVEDEAGADAAGAPVACEPIPPKKKKKTKKER